MKVSRIHFLVLALVFSAFIDLTAQNGTTWSFRKIDKNNDKRISFQEFKSLKFHNFDKNHDSTLSRYEFRRLKRYYAHEQRKLKKAMKKGLYVRYYKYALEPLVTYHSPEENFVELNK